MAKTVGKKMSIFRALSTLTQEERETYMQNVAMTTFGTKDNTGTKINVNVPLSAIVPTVPVTDVTVGGSSVVSGGVAAVPAVPDASSLADGTSITASNGKLSASIPVKDVTVGGTSVVSNGVAAIPAIPEGLPSVASLDNTKTYMLLWDRGAFKWQLTDTPKLPAYTIRVKYVDGYDPTTRYEPEYATCTQVSSSPNIWDITKVDNPTSWRFFIGNSSGLNSDVLEVIEANTTGVTSMFGTFSNCNALTSVALFDTSSCTDMYRMFYYCYNLTSVPLFDTSSVTNMEETFAACWDLATVPQFDTGSVTNMASTFSSCIALTTVPLFNTSSVTNMSRTFNACSLLTAIPLFNTSSVTNMDMTFAECPQVKSGAYELYTQAATQTKPPSSHTKTFYNCGASNAIPNTWKK